MQGGVQQVGNYMVNSAVTWSQRLSALYVNVPPQIHEKLFDYVNEQADKKFKDGKSLTEVFRFVRLTMEVFPRANRQVCTA